MTTFTLTVSLALPIQEHPKYMSLEDRGGSQKAQAPHGEALNPLAVRQNPDFEVCQVTGRNEFPTL